MANFFNYAAKTYKAIKDNEKESRKIPPTHLKSFGDLDYNPDNVNAYTKYEPIKKVSRSFFDYGNSDSKKTSKTLFDYKSPEPEPVEKTNTEKILTNIAYAQKDLNHQGIKIPEPDIANPKKRNPLQVVIDLLNLDNYGPAGALKNILDGDPNTKAMDGLKKGLNASFTGNKEGQTTYRDALWAAIDSKNPTINKIAQNLPKYSLATGLLPLLTAKGREKAAERYTKNMMEENRGNFTNPVNLMGLGMDIVLTPLSKLKGLVKGARTVLGGASFIEKAGDLGKAGSILKNLDMPFDPKSAQHLIDKTSSFLGKAGKYKGITFGSKNKLVLSAEAMAKFGDVTHLSDVGKLISKPLKAVGKSKPGTAIQHMFGGGAYADFIRLARQNPDKAMEHIAYADMAKRFKNIRKINIEEWAKEADGMKKTLGPFWNEESIRLREMGMIKTEVIDEVTKVIDNPEYLKATQNKAKSIKAAITRAEKERIKLGEMAEFYKKTGANKEWVDAMNQFTKITTELDAMAQLSVTESTDLLKILGTHLGESGFKLSEVSSKIMAAGKADLLDTGSLLSKSLKQVASDLTPMFGRKEAKRMAKFFKNAADEAFENIKFMVPDELAQYYTKTTSTGFKQFARKGLEGFAGEADNALQSEIIDIAKKADIDISKYDFEGKTPEMLKNYLRKLKQIAEAKAQKANVKPLTVDPEIVKAQKVHQEGLDKIESTFKRRIDDYVVPRVREDYDDLVKSQMSDIDADFDRIIRGVDKNSDAYKKALKSKDFKKANLESFEDFLKKDETYQKMSKNKITEIDDFSKKLTPETKIGKVDPSGVTGELDSATKKANEIADVDSWFRKTTQDLAKDSDEYATAVKNRALKIDRINKVSELDVNAKVKTVPDAPTPKVVYDPNEKHFSGMVRHDIQAKIKIAAKNSGVDVSKYDFDGKSTSELKRHLDVLRDRILSKRYPASPGQRRRVASILAQSEMDLVPFGVDKMELHEAADLKTSRIKDFVENLSKQKAKRMIDAENAMLEARKKAALDYSPDIMRKVTTEMDQVSKAPRAADLGTYTGSKEYDQAVAMTRFLRKNGVPAKDWDAGIVQKMDTNGAITREVNDGLAQLRDAVIDYGKATGNWFSGSRVWNLPDEKKLGHLFRNLNLFDTAERHKFMKKYVDIFKPATSNRKWTSADGKTYAWTGDFRKDFANIMKTDGEAYSDAAQKIYHRAQLLQKEVDIAQLGSDLGLTKHIDKAPVQEVVAKIVPKAQKEIGHATMSEFLNVKEVRLNTAGKNIGKSYMDKFPSMTPSEKLEDWIKYLKKTGHDYDLVSINGKKYYSSVLSDGRIALYEPTKEALQGKALRILDPAKDPSSIKAIKRFGEGIGVEQLTPEIVAEAKDYIPKAKPVYSQMKIDDNPLKKITDSVPVDSNLPSKAEKAAYQKIISKMSTPDVKEWNKKYPWSEVQNNKKMLSEAHSELESLSKKVEGFAGASDDSLDVVSKAKVEISDFKAHKGVYHGTHADLKSFVDDQGNLRFKPSLNFSGKTHGVSFTKDLEEAKFYSSRIKSTKVKNMKDAKMIQIDDVALSKHKIISEGGTELAWYPKDNANATELVIPKGQWRYADSYPEKMKFFKEYDEKAIKQAHDLSNEKLAKAVFDKELGNLTEDLADYSKAEQLLQSGAKLGDDTLDMINSYGVDHNYFDMEMHRRIASGLISEKEFLGYSKSIDLEGYGFFYGDNYKNYKNFSKTGEEAYKPEYLDKLKKLFSDETEGFAAKGKSLGSKFPYQETVGNVVTGSPVEELTSHTFKTPYGTIKVADGMKKAEVQTLVDALKDLPEELKGVARSAKSIELTPTRATITGVVKGKKKTTELYASFDGERVKLFRLDSKQPLHALITHELGHALPEQVSYTVQKAMHKVGQGLSSEATTEVMEALNKAGLYHTNVGADFAPFLKRGYVSTYPSSLIEFVDGKATQASLRLASRENQAEMMTLMFHKNPDVAGVFKKHYGEPEKLLNEALMKIKGDDLSSLIPPQIKAKQALLDQLKIAKKRLDNFDVGFDNAKSLKEVDDKILEVNKKLLKSQEEAQKVLKGKIDELIDPSIKRKIEVPEKIPRNVYTSRFENLPPEVKAVHDRFSYVMRDIAVKEGLMTSAEADQGMELFEWYTAHIMRDKIKTTKAGREFLDKLGITGDAPFNIHSAGRQHKEAIEKLNNAFRDKVGGEDFFEKELDRIFFGRTANFEKTMYDKKMFDNVVDTFGDKFKTLNDVPRVPGESDAKWAARLAKEMGVKVDPNAKDIIQDITEKNFKNFKQKVKSGKFVAVRPDPAYAKDNALTLDPAKLKESLSGKTGSKSVNEAMKGIDPESSVDSILEALADAKLQNPFIKVDVTQFANEEVFRKAGSDIFLMPSGTMEAYDTLVKSQFTKDKNFFLKAYDYVTGIFKINATVMNPPFHAMNKMGNTFRMFLEFGTDAANPRFINEAMQTMRHKGTMYGKTGSEWNRIVREYGVVNNSVFDDAMPHSLNALDRATRTKGQKILGAINPGGKDFVPYKIGRKTGEIIESTDRITAFFIGIERGWSIQEAADMSKKLLFDYSDLTKFESDVMKRAVPFYTWLRKNIPLQLEYLAKDPGKFAQVDRVLRMVNQEETEELRMYKPKYLQNNSIHLGGGKYVRVNLPSSDLQRSFAPKELFAAVNPIIKTPLELLMNKNVYFDSPIQQRPNAMTKAPEYAKLIPGLTTNTPAGKMMNPKVKHGIESLVPTARTISDVKSFLSKEGTDASDRRAMNWMTAIRRYDIDPAKAKEDALYGYLQMLRDELANKRYQGFTSKLD